ncbi:xylulokinase [Enterococcus timonensis]|uniref:xylulokinase n=1 Tax=Enterococcus timonensis TaxID=1852364 RepID=UPI0008D999FA|nr:xylulokinase [Enterococcus timonensis]
MDYVLGLDLGTGSIKGLLMNQKGQLVSSASSDYGLSTPAPGFSQQDPADWIKGANAVIAKLKENVADLKEHLVGISFSGQMHSLVLLDENDQVIRPAILWNDVRTTKQCQEIMEWAGKLVLKLTQNIALEGFTLPKILWVKENEPENFAKVHQFLLPKDYLGFYFTGNKQMELSDAAGTLLLDVEKKVWAEELAEIFELPKNIFPPLVQSTDLIGTIRPALAEKLGISSTTKVFAGGADNACAALGAGIVSEEIGLASIGTSGVFLSYEGEKKGHYQGKLHYFNHVLPNQYYAMGVTIAAGQSLSWFKKTFAPEIQFNELLQNVGKIPAGSDGLLFAPYIMGERTPHIDAKIRGSFLGMDARHTRDHFARAVLEGITFSLKDSQNLMTSVGKSFSKIISVGGGAKNPDWLQMQADIFNAEIFTLEAEEGPGLGAVMLAALGLGWFETPQDCVDTFVKYRTQHYQPNEKNVATYEKIYAIYQEVYGATKEISHQLLEQ